MLVHYSQTIYIKGTIEVNTSRIPFRKKWETKEIDSWFHAAGVLDETEVPAKIEDIITRLQNQDPETMQKINNRCSHEGGRNFSGWKFDRLGELRTEYPKDWDMPKAISILTAEEFGKLMHEVFTMPTSIT